MNRFQEMVRARLREKTPNYSILADFIKSDPSTIQKRLKENGTALRLDWLDEVSAFYQMSVSEMCALPGSAWQEVKPLEGQLLEVFRSMSELEKRSLLDVLERRPTPPRRKPRTGHPELTPKEQELVDLFAQVKRPGVREGVLQTLRGAAKDDSAGSSPPTRTTE
jgi:hypothetical protein